MNAYQLREMVKSRIPGYTDAEYLRELNDAYRKIADEIDKLDEYYFTYTDYLSVLGVQNNAATDFDLVNNSFLSYSLATSVGSGTVSQSIVPAQLGFGRAYTSNTAPTFPGTGTDQNPPGWGGSPAWTNPGNITKTDQQYASQTVLGFGQGDWLSATNFGFSIPATATILGIRVDMIFNINQTGWSPVIQVFKPGGISGTTFVGRLSSQNVVNTYSGDTSFTWGGPTDLGQANGNTPVSLTPADVNNAGFGVAVAFIVGNNNTTINVDSMRVTIYYSVPQSTVHPNFYKIKRVRVMPPGSADWTQARMADFNSDDYITDSQKGVQPAPSTVGPFRYVVYNRNFLRFARPLPATSLIEVTYSYDRPELAILNGGSIASSDGQIITGSGTTFTTIVNPRLQALLPTVDPYPQHPLTLESEIGIGAAPSAFYPVTRYTSDTQLSSIGAPTVGTNTAAQPYFLSNVPDIPINHHRAIATMATARMFSTPGKDPQQMAYWKEQEKEDVAALLDSMQKRDATNNARKRRFPMRQARRGFGVV